MHWKLIFHATLKTQPIEASVSYRQDLEIVFIKAHKDHDCGENIPRNIRHWFRFVWEDARPVACAIFANLIQLSLDCF